MKESLSIVHFIVIKRSRHLQQTQNETQLVISCLLLLLVISWYDSIQFPNTCLYYRYLQQNWSLARCLTVPRGDLDLGLSPILHDGQAERLNIPDDSLDSRRLSDEFERELKGQ